MRFSLPPVAPEPSYLSFYRTRLVHFAEHIGDVVLLRYALSPRFECTS